MSILLTPLGQRALELAAGLDDVDSLAAASRLRAEVPADIAAAALTQEALRRRARRKFGDAAASMWFTRDGLEQATRPAVARWRARRLVEWGITRVVDLGCGIGADAVAFAEAGLEVLAVECDEDTAEFAALNLARFPHADVEVGDVLDLVDPASPASPDTAVFLDPARRTAAGRSWSLTDLSPPWSFVEAMLGRGQLVVVKLGPGVPDRVLPTDAEVDIVDEGGDVVEATVWHGPQVAPGRRALRVDGDDIEVIASTERALDDGQGRIGRFVHEPVGAAIRAHAVADLPGAERWWGPLPGVAYASSDQPSSSTWATSFEVLEVLPWREQTLRAWCREHGIGTLEIKKRGLDVDPAALRRRLKLSGQASATVILAPHSGGAVCLVVRRVRDA
ncbi:class I SAM-dependent methyltransferase [Aestuariimicrobium ganziense]|uniref:class I SAM-dependent methyltransferase n=1 Tax=Aestuariimicrobium ganziense TaxID=2773677 RepID=UPI0019450065|nr:class I SAM-dependent methyltransferase [Aestuariimicrobium ganziense]